MRLYDQLFTVPDPEAESADSDFKTYLNPNSVEILRHALVEPSVAAAPPGARYQFERQGYFVNDIVDSKPGALVFNRIIELRDSWAKTIQPEQPGAKPAKPQAVANGKAAAKPAADATRARSETRDLARANNAELAARLDQYVTTLGLSADEADLLTGDVTVAHFFEAALAVHNNPKLVANWVMNEVLRELKEKSIADLPFGGAQLGALAALIDDNTISTTIAKEVFAEMLQNGGEPKAIVEHKGLQQLTDPGAVVPAIEKVIAANPDKASQYRAGKTDLLGFFVGQVMKETGGKANPQLVQDVGARKVGSIAKRATMHCGPPPYAVPHCLLFTALPRHHPH